MHLDLFDPALLATGGPTAATELLGFSLRDGEPPPERRVFVNRNLRLESIQFAGFDLDWTLAPYHRLPLEQLTFELTVERLIAGHDYPPALRQVEFRPDFPSRGLIIDKEAGTVLKMTRHRYVGTAYLGRQRLDSPELARLYRHELLRPSSNRFYHVDSLFELPEVNLFAEIIELGKRGTLPTLPYEQVFHDVRAALDWVHAHGRLKAQIRAEPERFLPRSPEVALALARMALGGRRLFLLTNSHFAYADALCSYLFDGALPGLSSWRQLFDLAVVGAGKPDFFRSRRPFVELDDAGTPGAEVDAPRWGGIYQGGSLQGLMQLLDTLGERVLYVGDHIYGDIVRSKLESTWRTALVVQELEEELALRATLQAELAELRQRKLRVARLGHEMDHLHDAMTLVEKLEREGTTVAREALAQIAQRHRQVASSHRLARRQSAELAAQVSDAFNPHWGSLFKLGSSQTLFANQLESFACIYTSRVANLAFYGTNHYFRVFEDPMMHEDGGV